YGAKLARAGHDVVFTARGENLLALQKSGLRLESSIEGDAIVAPVHAVGSPRGVGPFALVLVCVKVQHTESALAGLDAELAPDADLISLQNGVESESQIERLLGLQPMLRGLAYVGVELVAPGHV